MSEFGATSSATQPPGWYYAEGDPPGTHRYWDGTQWTGGPQLVQVGYAGASATPQFVKSASVGPRILAWLMDLAMAFAPLIVLASIGGSDTQLGIGYIALLLIILLNQVVLQGLTGQTIGKKIMGLTLVTEVTGETVGILRAFGRLFIASVLSNFSCGLYGLLDLAWPLFDGRNQRLTDKMLKLTVAPVDKKESFL